MILLIVDNSKANLNLFESILNFSQLLIGGLIMGPKTH